MRIKAPAKINLSLDVLGTRPDGYHEIITVMQPLDLHDIVEVEELPGGFLEVYCSDPVVPGGAGNLAYKAAALLRDAYNPGTGASIFIEKKIPVEAGLAGGSADAAAALKGLNNLWKLSLDEKTLRSLGERIGSDVPFCIMGKTCLAEGRGEALSPLPSFAGYGVILVKPCFGVSTARVYGLYDSLPAAAGPDTGALVEAVRAKDIIKVAGLMGNVLERVTAGIHPEIINIKDRLKSAGVLGALMSGSGPTVFGLCRDIGEARSIARKLDLGEGCSVLVTSTA